MANVGEPMRIIEVEPIQTPVPEEAPKEAPPVEVPATPAERPELTPVRR